MRIPRWLLRHTVTVSPYIGDSAYEPQYGPPVVVRCFVDEQTRTVRRPDGQEVTSSSTLYADLEAAVPPESRVVLPSGRETTVIAVLRRDGGGLATPDHLEIQLA